MFCCRISVFNCPSYLFITGTEVTPVKSWSTSSLSALHLAVENPADRFLKALLTFSRIGPLHTLKLCSYDYSAFEGRGVLISAPSLLICCPSMHLFTLALDECWKFRTHPYLVVTPCWPSLHCCVLFLGEEAIADGHTDAPTVVNATFDLLLFTHKSLWAFSLFKINGRDIFWTVQQRYDHRQGSVLPIYIHSMVKMWEEPWRQYGSNCPPGS